MYKSIIWQDTGIGRCKRDIHNARDHLLITWLGAVHKLHHAEGEGGISQCDDVRIKQTSVCDEGGGGGGGP